MNDLSSFFFFQIMPKMQKKTQMLHAEQKKYTYQKPAESGTLLPTADATQAGHLIKLETTTTPP
jgi:hypothetical protein